MLINKPTYQILTTLGAPKIHTSLLWDLTLLFLILGGAYFAFVFFFRNKLSKQAIRIKGKRRELAPIISNFLFHSPEDPREEQKEYVELKITIRDYLNNKGLRKIIAKVLFDLQKDVAGGTRERLFKLFKELELHHDAFQKLRHWRWEIVAQGILELSQMEVKEAYLPIRKFINDRRGVVRKQAELATVSLRPDGIDYLLDTTKHSISEWQQIKLIEVLGKRKNYTPPQFKAWLLSQNKDVVLFALRLIKHYNQKGAEPSIKELVKHKNDEIRLAAIQCIVDFNFVGAIPVLKQIFWKSSNPVKISILRAFSVLGNENDIPFLEKVSKKESVFSIISKAQSSINTIVPETILPSKDIVEFKEADQTELAENVEGVDLEEIEERKDVLAPNADLDDVAPTAIEVEDIEYYDEFHFSETPKEAKQTETTAPAFELTAIEDEYGKSMDHILGLITPSNSMDSNDLIETYDKVSREEKSRMVEMMEDSADKRELPLLEHIAENEDDLELRFQAFKTMKSIQKNEESNRVEEPEGIPTSLAEHSIFHPLFYHTDDLNAKLILLEELMAVGDEKEIPFLKSLLSNQEKEVIKMAKKAIAFLANCDQSSGELDQVQELNQTEEASEKNKERTEASTQNSVEDKRIPMELFMLYEELGIASTHKVEEEPNPFDFELSKEFFLEQEGEPSQLDTLDE